jgi:hypothetical protein
MGGPREEVFCAYSGTFDGRFYLKRAKTDQSGYQPDQLDRLV